MTDNSDQAKGILFFSTVATVLAAIAASAYWPMHVVIGGSMILWIILTMLASGFSEWK